MVFYRSGRPNKQPLEDCEETEKSTMKNRFPFRQSRTIRACRPVIKLFPAKLDSVRKYLFEIKPANSFVQGHARRLSGNRVPETDKSAVGDRSRVD